MHARGVHFVSYLENGNYYGVDCNKALLDAGRNELETQGLLWKDPILEEISDFAFVTLSAKFDYLLAQSRIYALCISTASCDAW